MELNENDLFLAVKNDSYVAFNQLFERFYRRLCLFVFKYTDDEDASRDVVQELFIKVWTRRHQIVIHDTVSASRAQPTGSHHEPVSGIEAY